MDEFHQLSVGDNSSAASNIEHENVEDAASGDVDTYKEKGGHLDSKTLASDDNKITDAMQVKSVDHVRSTDVSQKSEIVALVPVLCEATVDAKADVADESTSATPCKDQSNINKDPNDKQCEVKNIEEGFEANKQKLQVLADIANTSILKNSNDDGNAPKTLEMPTKIDNNQNINDVIDGTSSTTVTDVVDKTKEFNTSSKDTKDEGSKLFNNDGLECAIIDKDRSEIVRNKPLETGAILNPLMLEGSSSSTNVSFEKLTFSPSKHKMLDTETPCMLCDHIESNMDSKSHYDEYWCHLLVEHKLVVADKKLIADLQSYAIYWKKRFSEAPLEQFCPKIKTNTGSKDIGESEEYYLLCDASLEDKQIREQLQFDNLKKLLLRQEFERKDESFSHTCPFCNKMFQGNRLILFNHMTVDHNFNIGHPDNIVNVRELLDEIQGKLNNLQCLFCENIFRDRAILREHMRKKMHRRLNPENKDYDKYYMINYLELGKNWLKLQSEPEKLDGASDDWSGWLEESQKAYCFFCKSSFSEAGAVYEHMKTNHNFDFIKMREEMHLSFYQQIKLINFIRRQVHLAQQDGCSDIITRIKDSLKSSTRWNQPQYYFSTYEDDTILCQLEDKEGVFEPEDSFVIGEDGIDCRSIVQDSVLTDLVVRGVFDDN